MLTGMYGIMLAYGMGGGIGVLFAAGTSAATMSTALSTPLRRISRIAVENHRGGGA